MMDGGSAQLPVMVVDDDEDTRECMKSLLELQGYNVVTAGDGCEALAKLYEGYKPALILLDIMMPRMNGYQLRQRLAIEPQLATIPVVLCSCCDEVSAVAARPGVAAYLQKPIDVETLLTVVAACCRAASPGR